MDWDAFRGGRFSNKRFLAVGLMIALCVMWASALRLCASIPGYARIGLARSQKNSFLLPVQIQGRTVKLLLDTGAVNAYLHTDAVDRLGLVGDRSGFKESTDAGGRKRTLETLRFPNVQVGPVRLGFLDVLLLRVDGPSVKEHRGDGLVGLPFLIVTRALLDFPGPCLWLPTEEGAQERMADVMRAKGFSTCQIRGRNCKMLVPGRIAGTECDLMIDSGAELTILDRGQLKSRRIQFTETRAYMVGVHGSRSRAALIRVPSFVLGGQPILDEVVAAEVDLSSLQRGGEPPVMGLIGYELLCFHSAVIDCGKGRLFLRGRQR